MLGSPSNFTENECFCLNKTGGILGDDYCLLDGAMELQSCLSEYYVKIYRVYFYLNYKSIK